MKSEVLVGAEMFFSSRGHFNRPAGTTVSTDDRLSVGRLAELRQLPFQGLDRRRDLGVRLRPAQVGEPRRQLQSAQTATSRRSSTIRASSTRSRTSRPTSATSPAPAPLALPLPCANPPPPTSLYNPNQGLLIGDNGNINLRAVRRQPVRQGQRRPRRA